MDLDASDIQFIEKVLSEQLVLCVNDLLDLRRYYGKSDPTYYRQAMDRNLTRKLRLESILDKIKKERNSDA